MYTPKQITLDLEEYQAMEKQITLLTAPVTGPELSERELQEATGKLLYTALNNPQLFRFKDQTIIDLGKYEALIATVLFATTTSSSAPQLIVKFSKKVK